VQGNIVTSILEFWNRQSPVAKTGLVIGILFIIGLTAGLGFWAYRTDYQVLFADLASRDAASMTAELDRIKVPYQLADGGNTILVPKEQVYKTRLKLMEKDVPLHGAVGFEVFNNADFGMTEFVQKVNYQRAIQGELTRTILSIDEIQAARVHLATPEQGLFKKPTSKAKASVTVTMKHGKTLAPEQVAGIQRLVAASVPDIQAEDVTVLDQHGVALTRVAGAEGDVALAGAQLDSKRSTEEYLLRKVTQVLDRTLGQGQAIASVDVSLNLDQSRVTTEEVLPAKSGNREGPPTGVVVRERQSTREGKTTASGLGSTQGGTQNEVTSVESDYQVGRRVEQVVSAAGGVRRMTVAVVVKKPMDDAQLAKLHDVVSLALGANNQRGDAVVVYSLDRMASTTTPVAGNISDPEQLKEEKDVATASQPPVAPATAQSVIVALGMLFLASSAVAMWYVRRKSGNNVGRRLTSDERERMLANVRHWIDGGTSVREAVERQP
jgi:flagellar M-ring protein FliF